MSTCFHRLSGPQTSKRTDRYIFFFFLNIFWGIFSFCSYNIQHCFICRPSDSTVPTDAGIEPRTVATCALSVRRSNHQARSHPYRLDLIRYIGNSYCRSHRSSVLLSGVSYMYMVPLSSLLRSLLSVDPANNHCSLSVLLFYGVNMTVLNTREMARVPQRNGPACHPSII